MVAGLLGGTISSLLGVAGGEFIIPILIFIFGADIRTAGTASVLISIPAVMTGVARHWLTGHYRSQSMLACLVLPMCIGSFAGAMIGGYLAAWAPTGHTTAPFPYSLGPLVETIRSHGALSRCAPLQRARDRPTIFAPMAR